MTKIYTSEQDYKRDQLHEQTSQLEKKAFRQEASGFSTVATGFALDSLNQSFWKKSWISLAGTTLSLLGFIHVIKGYFTSREAHSTKREMEQIPPGTTLVMQKGTSHTMPDPSFTNKDTLTPDTQISEPESIEKAPTAPCRQS